MSKVLPSPDPAKSPTTPRFPKLRLPKPLRAIAIVLCVAGLTLIPALVPLAQHVKESQSPITVTGVNTRQTASGTVVTVSADAPLSRTQTWQEGNKFHLVLPYAGGGQIKNLPRGVKVNRVSNSLEIVVNMKAGASVTVDPRFNHLNLVVNGGLNSAQNEADDAAQPSARTQERAAARDNAARSARERNVTAERSSALLTFMPGRTSKAGDKSLASSSATAQHQATGPIPAADQTQTRPVPSAGAYPATGALPATPSTSTSSIPTQNATRNSLPAANNSAAPPLAQSQTTASRGLLSMIFSTTGVVVMLAFGFLAFAYLRLRANSTEMEEVEDKEIVSTRDKAKAAEQTVALASNATTGPPAIRAEQVERRKSSRRKSDKLAASPALMPSEKADPGWDSRIPTLLPATAALFGSYRVDQEVGKLVLGQPHRMDVLASRAPEDRRSIETSLLKAMKSAETDEAGRRRARQALEEYGFLARHSAALLLAQDAFERVAAARTLGEIGAPTALPFLLEALYDTDATVRAQAVSSIGALRLPSAIGALLDTARRYPEIPAALLSQALNACSLDCLSIGDAFETAQPLLSGETRGEFNGEIKRLEPAGAYEQLPEFLADETLLEALERLKNADVEVRTAASRRLAQFQTQSSVAALTALATDDPEPVVRAAAVTSLGEINHETVFAPVLMAFADEAREVQAAAARALSRLNFNRADAYVRIIETADEKTLGSVARACIKARVASQAIERLASEDRRQAYEAFSLLSLLAKANEITPILNAIAEHSNPNVQMAAIRLLGMTGSPEVAQHFRQLVVRDGLPEKVRTSLLEVVYKIDQALPV